MKTSHIFAIALAVGLGSWAASAQAATLDFFRITNTSPNIANQLGVDVTDAGSSQVSFKFTNNVGTPSSVTGIYFDGDGSLGFDSFEVGGTGVAFSAGGSTNLAGGGPYNFDTSFVAHSNSGPGGGVPGHGLNEAADYLTIVFDLLGGKTFSDVLAMLGDGSLRIGLHVQSIEGGTSDSYLNNPPSPVPLPAAAYLFGTALAGLGILGRRRRQAQAA